jgi:hypothetical protein
MGFSEIKNNAIKKLMAVKKAKDHSFDLASAERVAKDNELQSKINMADKHLARIHNADTAIMPLDEVNEILKSLLAEIKFSSTHTRNMHREALALVKLAHALALKTVALANAIEAVNTEFTNEMGRGLLISAQLVQDSQKALVDVKTAVAHTTKALLDAITAAASVGSLQNSLAYTQSNLNTGLPLIFAKNNGWKAKLLALKEKAQEFYQQSLKERKIAEDALQRITQTFNQLNSERMAAAAALDAAMAVVE